ncbi:cryptochrome/photolyase family protein [Neiella sp. HB171785]|uniref:Cryptochrome/photolyase family protein n=1 Tax=Neiella litorisoli TaxID=2771431 RepID=A0A8J6UQB6_9GAMM|nr:cryptochrome/photolyase family protein [Neiella litorisoli]MBD1390782.1 cryptochrome/photolyase family protein [Neiella litorisoli]
MTGPAHTLRLILGDQLNASHSWFERKDDGVLYLIAELHQETGYVKHHVQKVGAFFAAMKGFAEALASAGHRVLHLTLDDTAEFASLPQLIDGYVRSHQIQVFEYQRPDEYRLLQQLEQLELPQGVTKRQWDTEHFLVDYDELPLYFVIDKNQRMETFYRKMRQRFDILMAGGKPIGGQWNYDADNRAKLKSADIAEIPAPLLFANDVRDINVRLERHQVATIGERAGSLLWPVNRQQSLQLLEHFCRHCLPRFGLFQDAMTEHGKQQWSLYHSRLSFALNSKMISPKQVIERALDYFQQYPEQISLAQIEGFVRQIIGWREFVRGIYWRRMPQYGQLNYFDANNELPDFFWHGRTNMNCMAKAIGQSLKYAYAHHIQRLMITGNFCLLAGIDPDQVDAWYLGIYIDAIEWVEMPNTRGMSQFADGGVLASKPYAASANYVHKMSDYCTSCHYDHKAKTGDRSCPLNSLYWHFLLRHRDRLSNNPRVGMIYRNWDRQGAEQQAAISERAAYCLANLNDL